MPFAALGLWTLRRRRVAEGLVAVSLALVASSARGQAPSGPTFDVDIADTTLAGLGLWVTGLGIGAQAMRWEGTPACRSAPRGSAELCDRDRIFALDRPAFAHSWRAADAASDVLLMAMLVSPFAYSTGRAVLDDRLEEPGRTLGQSAAVSFQALGAVLLATTILKLVVRRPRPLTYDARFSREERFDGDARLSFPSGHTSMAFAAASLTSIMIHEEVADPGVRAAGIAGAFGAAALVGYFRIAARKHFSTDVLAGALLGGGLAALVAWPRLADDEGRSRGDGSSGGGSFRLGWGGTF